MISSQFLSRFKMICFSEESATDWDEPVTAQSIVAKYPWLECLWTFRTFVNHHAQPLADQMREFCKLKQLVHLVCGYCNLDDQHQSFGEMFGIELSASKTTPRFESLIHLTLDVWLRKSDDFHSIFDTPQLKYMFPVLKSLIFDFVFEDECTSCGDAYKKMDLQVTVVQNNTNVQSALGNCAEQIIRPWRRYCPGLQNAYIDCDFFVSFDTPQVFDMEFNMF